MICLNISVCQRVPKNFKDTQLFKKKSTTFMLFSLMVKTYFFILLLYNGVI